MVYAIYEVKIPGRNPLKAVAWGTKTIELLIMPDNFITLEDGAERYKIFQTEFSIDDINEEYEKCWSWKDFAIGNSFSFAQLSAPIPSMG